MLHAVIQSFQRLYPEVTFSLAFVPLDDLYSTYRESAYLGKGPSLLLGPSNWGPVLARENLITPLDPFIPANYLSDINPAALSSSIYQNTLISFPLSIRGLVLYRNAGLISEPAASFEDLINLSKQVTRGGIVGSYLERGSYFSAANVIGLGGQLMDSGERPAFNNEYGLEWIKLLSAYDDAGAVTFNTNHDLDMFQRSRVGIIIDGSWNMAQLAQAIGPENLVIDPWPRFGSGHMSGWVESDNVFLNSNIQGNDRFAALSFMGYLLDPNVQMRLAEVGHIPSVTTAQPRDPLIQQAMIAFSNGAAYPTGLDKSLLDVYWNELDLMLSSIFERGVDPSAAIKFAYNNIFQTIRIMKAAP